MPHSLPRPRPQHPSSKLSYKQALVSSLAFPTKEHPTFPQSQLTHDSSTQNLSVDIPPQIDNDLPTTLKDVPITQASPRCVSVHPSTVSPLSDHRKDPPLPIHSYSLAPDTSEHSVIIASDAADTVAIDALRQHSHGKIDQVYNAFDPPPSAKKEAAHSYHRFEAGSPILPADTSRTSPCTEETVPSVLSELSSVASDSIVPNHTERTDSAQMRPNVVSDECAAVSLHSDADPFRSVLQPQPVHRVQSPLLHTPTFVLPSAPNTQPHGIGASSFVSSSGLSPHPFAASVDAVYDGDVHSTDTLTLPTFPQQLPLPQSVPMHTYPAPTVSTTASQYIPDLLQPPMHNHYPFVTEPMPLPDMSPYFAAPLSTQPLPSMFRTTDLTHVPGLSYADGATGTSQPIPFGMQQGLPGDGYLPSSIATAYADYATLSAPTQVLPGIHSGFMLYDGPSFPAVLPLPQVADAKYQEQPEVFCPPPMFVHGAEVSLLSSLRGQQPPVQFEPPAVRYCFQYGCCRIAEGSIHPPLPEIAKKWYKKRKQFAGQCKDTKQGGNEAAKHVSSQKTTSRSSEVTPHKPNQSPKSRKKAFKRKDVSHGRNEDVVDGKKSLWQKESEKAKGTVTERIDVKNMSFPPLPGHNVESPHAVSMKKTPEEKDCLTKTKNLTFKDVVEKATEKQVTNMREVHKRA